MSLFHTISFNFLRNDEVYNLSKGIFDLSPEYSGEGQPLQPFILRHNAAYQKLNSALMQEQGSVLTSKIGEADDHQDDIYLGFRHYVEAYTHSPDQAKRDAAERLMNKIRTYGYSMQDASFSEQHSRMGNLLDDLNNDAQAMADITTIGAGDWKTALDSAYSSFVTLREQRRDEELGKPEITTLEARKEVKKALNDLFNFADAMVVIEPEGPYQPFANEVNLIIDEIMRNVRMRRE